MGNIFSEGAFLILFFAIKVKANINSTKPQIPMANILQGKIVFRLRNLENSKKVADKQNKHKYGLFCQKIHGTPRHVKILVLGI